MKKLALYNETFENDETDETHVFLRLKQCNTCESHVYITLTDREGKLDNPILSVTDHGLYRCVKPDDQNIDPFPLSKSRKIRKTSAEKNIYTTNHHRQCSNIVNGMMVWQPGYISKGDKFKHYLKLRIIDSDSWEETDRCFVLAVCDFNGNPLINSRIVEVSLEGYYRYLDVNKNFACFPLDKNGRIKMNKIDNIIGKEETT